MALSLKQQRIVEMDAKAAAKSVTSYRGHFTRTLRALNDAVAKNNARPSRHLGRLIERYLAEGEERFSIIQFGYEHILECGQEDEKTAAANNLELEEKRREDMRAAATDSIARVTPQGAQQEGVFTCRKELRPQELTREASPAELRAWTQQFKRYYRGSNMKALSEDEARGYFNACISLTLQMYLATVLEEEAPIFDEPLEDNWNAEMTQDSCMGALHFDFLARYPLASRRCTALKLKQPRGQTWSTFRMKARETLEDAYLEDFTRDQLEVTIMINACTDEELKKLFLEKEDITVRELDRIAENYERTQADIKGTTDVDRAFQVSTNKGNNNNNNNGGGARRRDSRDNRDADKDVVCLRCGNKGHKKPACKVNADIKCNFCDIKGHMERACQKKKREKKDKAKQVKQEKKPETEDSSSDDEYEYTSRVIARARSIDSVGSDTPPLTL